MTGTTHRQFFGDEERDFALPNAQAFELERVTGSGFGALARRILSDDYSLADLHQTIRLALIGGGTDPQEAAALLSAYVYPRPVNEARLLTLSIVGAAYFGTDAEGEKEAQ
ncbi:gene transfer agent family protein [Aureimonas sp. AU20]|uniref:gene transfer agent family protein n=1 Tax=Aureimonas sp. AU20 TaxID=1349819 RepID=UPI00071F7884|nr:gene transfer agent family protein [Aureimonas sp. AU20]ALN73590.1 hypothetical protein M673_12750 [Aureimonas sp. AU20]